VIGRIAAGLTALAWLSLVTAAIGQGPVGNAFATALVLPLALVLVLRTAAESLRRATPRVPVVAGVLVAITLAAIAATPWLVRAATGLPSGSLHELTTNFAVVTVPGSLLLLLCGALGSGLPARERPTLTARAAAIGGSVSVAGMVAFLRLFQGQVTSAEWTRDMASWLAGTATSAVAVTAAVLAVARWRWVPAPDTETTDTEYTHATTAWFAVAVTLGLGASLLACRAVWAATGIDETSRGLDPTVVPGVAALVAAAAVVVVAHLVVGQPLVDAWQRRACAIALTSTVDPGLLRSEIARTYRRGLTVPAVVTVPVSVALVVFAVPLMGLLVTARQPSEIAASASVLAMLAPLPAALGVILLNHRILGLAGPRHTALTLTIPVAAIVAMAALGAALLRTEWVTLALAAGLSLAGVLTAALGSWVTRHNLDNFGSTGAGRTLARTLLAALGAGYVAWGLVIALTRALAGLGRPGYAALLALGGMLFGVVYFLLLRLLHVQELADLVVPVVNRYDRRPPGRHRPGE